MLCRGNSVGLNPREDRLQPDCFVGPAWCSANVTCSLGANQFHSVKTAAGGATNLNLCFPIPLTYLLSGRVHE